MIASIGKERALRLHHSRFNNSSRTSSTLTALTSLAALLFLFAGAGCKNGFIDPSEMGRFEPYHGELPIQILDHLDIGGLEVDPRFRNATPVSAEDLVPGNGDYRLGPNDLISVSITDLVAPGIETVKNVRISEGGTISLPSINPIKAQGLTEAQLEVAIRQAYRDADIITNATVTVVTLELRSRNFTAYGAVTQVGEYQILSNDFRLLQALAYARGVTSPTGIDYIYVIRRTGGEGTGGANGNSAPAMPTTRPNTDVLVPRSDAGLRFKHAPVALVTRGKQPAGEMSPTTEPTTQPGDAEGRMITIEGHAMEAGQPTAPANPPQPEGNNAMAPAPPVAPGAPMNPAPEAAPTSEGFQFNAPQQPSNVRIIKVPFSQLNDNGDLRYNIVIRPGDVIFVPNPNIGEYYMGGHVQRVGVYSLTARKITLKQAVIGAGMLDQLAIPQRTQIVRRLPGLDQEVFTTVDLAKIFAGETPDIYLKPDDQVVVGTSWWAPFVAAVRNGFRITYGFGFLYDRNYFQTDNNP